MSLVENMSDAVETVEIGSEGSPREGWGVLHLFCRVGRGFDPQRVESACKALIDDGYQLVTYAVLGHKADIGFMALGPDLWRLRRFQSDIEASSVEIAYSYFSLTEVSEYAKGMPMDRKAPRLYPTLPPAGKRAICFYPMSKRREESNNWYALPYEERERLMYEHGASGRKFAGRVLQLITGSTGLDDYEWGVTLFAERPDDLKEVVYTMRFDEASTLYADFGPFYAGLVADVDEVLALFHA
jgi:chlorite dismutase